MRFRRFLLGALVGAGAMYWYIHSGHDLGTSVSGWMDSAATNYRGDKTHRQVNEALR